MTNTPAPHNQSGSAGRPRTSLGGKQSRREFLRRSALVAGAGFATPFALDLLGLTNSGGGSPDPYAQGSTADGYRALVCVFLYGGNDHYDTFVPHDTASYNTYAAARGALARPRHTILPIDPVGGFRGAGTFGFAPEMGGLKGLFDAGDLAVVTNIGTLVRPTSKSDFAHQRNLPPQLFSHNDQQSFWQSSDPEGATTGWGGRIADLVLEGNSTHSMFTSISVSGNAVMMTGHEAFQYQIASSGVTKLHQDTFRSPAAMAGIREMMELEQPGLFSPSHVNVSRRALNAADDLSSAVDTASATYNLDAFFDTRSSNNALANTAAQLKTVARLIAAGRDSLGLKRQVFFVSMGGFDNHSGLVQNHLPLLSALDSALTGFHQATKALGVSDGVTTFTASDFGRSLASNTSGTDHGWGGHHIVMGGAVDGKRVIGDVPEVANDGPDDVGHGRLLPTTSVDQYAATMARWMGAGSSELEAIVPNIANFDSDDLQIFTTSSKPTDDPPITNPTTTSTTTSTAPPTTTATTPTTSTVTTSTVTTGTTTPATTATTTTTTEPSTEPPTTPGTTAPTTPGTTTPTTTQPPVVVGPQLTGNGAQALDPAVRGEAVTVPR
jgi:uncharacterized protein (DUF1501 family)